MKKSLKRGFFLSETIVVIAVVGVVLLGVFAMFSSLYTNYKLTEKYNTANAITAAINVKKYYESTNNNVVNLLENNSYTDVTNSEIYSNNYYSKLKEMLQINTIYIIDLEKVFESGIDDFYISLRRYIKTLNKVGGKVLVIVLNNNEFGYIQLSDEGSSNCIFDGNMLQGAEYVNGQYTYRYRQQSAIGSESVLSWQDMSTDGWAVILTDRDSTDTVTTKLCTSINDKPIVSMRNMFRGSKATSVDLSSFNTSNVTDMSRMFHSSKFINLDLSVFDTSNVKNMYTMFYNAEALTIDLSSFNTSSVTTMEAMFNRTKAKTIDLSSFNTNRVTTMYAMFYNAEALSLDLSSFNTSNVTTMESMLNRTKAKTLDLSSFNTNKVTNMKSMFYASEASILDLSSFDTSNATDTAFMFGQAAATTGYAKTQVDAAKFNNSTSKPSELTFVVKA